MRPKKIFSSRPYLNFLHSIQYESESEMTPAPNGASAENAIALAIALNSESIQIIIIDREATLKQTIVDLQTQIQSLGLTNTITEYQQQTVDETIADHESLELIEALPEFAGAQASYVSWGQAANTAMSR